MGTATMQTTFLPCAEAVTKIPYFAHLETGSDPASRQAKRVKPHGLTVEGVLCGFTCESFSVDGG